MKIRRGFVSNSSSSSYTCLVCGDNESGYDMSLYEAEMMSCSCGHVYHISCGKHGLVTSINHPQFLEMIRAYREENKEWKEVQERCQRIEEICTSHLVTETGDIDIGDTEELQELFDYIQDELRGEYPRKFCPICTYQSLSDEDALEYLMTAYDLKRETILKAIKSEDYYKTQQL